MPKAQDNMTPSLKRIQKQLRALPNEAVKKWIKETPKRTGNARSQTRLEGSDVIWAKYNYASKLNEGFSKQAPEGMVPGTERFLNQRLRQILRK